MNNTSYIKPTIKDQSLLQKGAYINGQWLNDTTDNTFNVVNPINNEVIVTLPEHQDHTVDAAIDSASNAFKSYKHTSVRDRARWLRKVYDLMMENIDDLSKILVWENGKALSAAVGEIKYAASYFEWYAEEATRNYGTTIQTPTTTNRVFTRREPVGVCAFFCPWNFPSAMITRKTAAALAAGCTVIVKPDASTPLSALALTVLIERAGFPNGVFNVLLSHQRTPDIGLRLCQSTKVKKISFTGSTRVGKILMKQSADTLKKLSLELGGNAPFIVFQDADLENAVEQAIVSKFRGLGQTCVCANRLYVHSSIIDKFSEMLAAKVKQFKIGYGLDPSTTHGCLVSTATIDKVESHIHDALERGAKIVLKGGPLPELGPAFYAPYVLSNVSKDSLVCKEETFGPLCPIIPFDTIQEAVNYANDTEYGLASYIFSENISTIYEVSEAIEAGMISCNTGLFSDAAIPFGGIKESGFGREGSLHGLEDYTYVKTVTIGNIHNVY